jgi:hypothetical protein
MDASKHSIPFNPVYPLLGVGALMQLVVSGLPGWAVVALKVFVLLVGGYTLAVVFERGRAGLGYAIFAGIVLFNPLFEAALGRYGWVAADFLFAGVLCWACWALRKPD